MPTDRRPLTSRCQTARPVQDQPPRKPSNWWAFQREPWKRVSAEILARERGSAEREKERADRALRNAFAFACAALAMANAPAVLAVANAPPLVPEDWE